MTLPGENDVMADGKGQVVGARASDLPVRLASAIVMLVVAGGALWLGGWVWSGFVALLAAGEIGAVRMHAEAQRHAPAVRREPIGAHPQRIVGDLARAAAAHRR